MSTRSTSFDRSPTAASSLFHPCVSRFKFTGRSLSAGAGASEGPAMKAATEGAIGSVAPSEEGAVAVEDEGLVGAVWRAAKPSLSPATNTRSSTSASHTTA